MSEESKLNLAIEDILHGDNPHAYAIIAAVQRCLQQFNLTSRVEAHEILHDAYLRGRKYIANGGTINNPKAWLKGAAFNIIRERQRQLDKHKLTDPQSVAFENQVSSSDYWVSPQVLEQRLVALQRALILLAQDDPETVQLVTWRLLERLSWKNIRDRLIQEQGDAPSEEALRQRATRGKRRLRRIYHEMNETIRSL